VQAMDGMENKKIDKRVKVNFRLSSALVTALTAEAQSTGGSLTTVIERRLRESLGLYEIIPGQPALRPARAARGPK